MKYRFLILALFSGILQTGFGIPLYFRHIEVDNGLSNNDVSCCIQDKFGFMWFGTRDGLNRFDGNSFKIYKDYKDTSGKPGGNWINCLTSDKDGYLWLGTDLGVYRYNHVDETFSSLEFTQKLNVKEITFDQENNLWMILGNTLIRYNLTDKSHQIINHPDNYLFTSLCFTTEGELWISTTEGLITRYNEEDNTFNSYDLYNRSFFSSGKSINKISISPASRNIYIGTITEGMKIFNLNSLEYKDIPLHKTLRVNGFLEVSPDELWIVTHEGLYIYRLSSDSLTHFSSAENGYNPLSSDVLHCIYKDNENGVWIGTYNGGINYRSPYLFFKKDYNQLGNKPIERNIVHAIEMGKDHIWVGTQDMGIIEYDTRTGGHKNYRNILSDRNIHGLKLLDDKLWIGTRNHGVAVMDTHSGKIMKSYSIRKMSREETNLPIIDLCKKRDNQLLAATSQGLFQYNDGSDCFELMAGFPVQSQIQAVLEDHEGVIWGGTFRYGLFYYHPKSGKSGKLQLDSVDSVSANIITDIYEDESFNLWIATRDGVRKYDRNTRQVKKYGIREGLPGNATLQIMEDAERNMWISTTKGLACLNPATNEIRIFTTAHGLPSNQFNYNSSAKDSEGNLYFGTIKGMISFRPEDLPVSTELPPVYLTDFITNATSVSLKSKESITFSKGIVLRHGESTFSIEFSALTYIAPRATQYAYYMEGFEKNWNYVKDERSAHYTKLPPGQYVFKVKASNASGIWNEHITTLSISVLPPWWLSTLSVIIYTLTGLIVIFGLITYFVRQNKKKMMRQLQIFENEKEKELYKSKIDFFINIAHEIRTPLTLIKGPLDKIIGSNSLSPDDKGQLTVMNKNVNRLLSLANQLLDFRKTETAGYRLNFVNTDIVDLIKETCERFKSPAYQQGLELSIELEVDSFFAFIDKEGCTKILSNLLSNAIKYAKGIIIVSFKTSQPENTFIIDIMNDGEPIPEKVTERIFEPFYRGGGNSIHKPGTGLGLPLARSLAEMHRGSLSLIQQKNNLTTFRICLPTHQMDPIFIDKEKEQDQQMAATEHTYKREISRQTVLIVEDSKDMQQFLGQEINEKYNVMTADNGEEALKLLQQERIQLIITDIMMPVMDGFALLKKVKTDVEFSHIPVILLTAQSTMQSKLDGLEFGADAYIEKPFSSELLLAQISNLLANRENIREFYFHSPVANLKSIANTKADEVFLNRLNEIINANINNEYLDVDMIAEKMNTTRSTLYRKINAISNLSPNELIKITRLKKAAELLAQGNLKIYEISNAVGFGSQPYFSREFTKQFKMSPTEYAKNFQNIG